MASSRLIARQARETLGSLAPAAHFAKFESRGNGNFLRTRRARWPPPRMQPMAALLKARVWLEGVSQPG